MVHGGGSYGSVQQIGCVIDEGHGRVRGQGGSLPRARAIVAAALCLSAVAMLLTYKVWLRGGFVALHVVMLLAAFTAVISELPLSCVVLLRLLYFPACIVLQYQKVV